MLTQYTLHLVLHAPRPLPLRRWLFAAAVALLGLTHGPTAIAADGRLEISQSCVATGCFPADAPGFPVTTDADQSYVLTSGLVVPDADTSAIALAAGSRLDLNGFTIEGPVSCTGLPATCSATGSGVGVFATGSFASVQNGTIRGMGDDGIRGAGGLAAEDLLIQSNGGDGIQFGVISTSGNGLIRNCRLLSNGIRGIDYAFGNGQGTLVESNVVHANGSDGLRGSGALIVDNRFSFNGGLGVSAAFGGGGSAMSGTAFFDNNDGGVQYSGVAICGSSPSCP